MAEIVLSGTIQIPEDSCFWTPVEFAKTRAFRHPSIRAFRASGLVLLTHSPLVQLEPQARAFRN